MAAKIIDGKAISEVIRSELKEKVARLSAGEKGQDWGLFLWGITQLLDRM